MELNIQFDPEKLPCPIIDTHTHLTDASFDEDRAHVIQRAMEYGIRAIFLMTEQPEEVEKALSLVNSFPQALYPACGLYPAYCTEENLDLFQNYLVSHLPKWIAIGEVGLDFWIARTDDTRARQQDIFKHIINLARTYDLPLNVHSRSAGRYTVHFLIEHGATKVQMHAFDGKYSSAQPALRAGFFFSIPASIVRSKQKQKLVLHLPLEVLLLESDSPVLGPAPNMRNEPLSCLIALDTIARIKQVDPYALAEQIYQNTLRLYPGLREKF